MIANLKDLLADVREDIVRIIKAADEADLLNYYWVADDIIALLQAKADAATSEKGAPQP